MGPRWQNGPRHGDRRRVVVPLIRYVEILDLIFRIAVMTWGFGAIALALYKRLATPSIPIPPPIAA